MKLFPWFLFLGNKTFFRGGYEALRKKWKNWKPLSAAEVSGETVKYIFEVWLLLKDTERERDFPAL